MKLQNSSIYLSYPELQEFGFKQDYLWLSKNRNTNGLPSYIHEEFHGVQHVLLSSIPRQSVEKYNLPSEEELIKKYKAETLRELLRIDSKVYDFYYATPESEYAHELQELAAWMMLCAPLNRRKAREIGYDSVDDFYDHVITAISDLKRSVSNLQIFKRKLKPFRQYYNDYPDHFDLSNKDNYLFSDSLYYEYELALQTLISKKFGKKNAAKLKQKDPYDRQAESQQALLVKLYASPHPMLNIQQTWIAYMRTASDEFKKWKTALTDHANQVGDPALQLYAEVIQPAMKNDVVSSLTGLSKTKIIELKREIKALNLPGWDEKCAYTVQTAENFLYRPDIKQVWYAKRYGKKPSDDVFKRVTKRKPASFANAKWVIDGKPMQINFTHKGNHYSRIHVFVVMDEYSWAIIGYHISFSENSDQVLMALRNACRMTGQIPYEIQCDNGSAINNWHVNNAISAISQKKMPAAVGNARSKRVENFFQHFNTQVLKFQPGFYGKHHNTLDRRANEEHMLMMAKTNQLPSFGEAYDIMDESFDLWNNIVFDNHQPIKKYHSSRKETEDKQMKFTPALDIEAFWYQPGKMMTVKDTTARKQKTMQVFKPTEYTYSNYGIIVDRKDPLTKKTEKFLFDIPEAAFNARNIGNKFTIRVEPDKFKYARIYQNGKPLTDEYGKPYQAQLKLEAVSAQVDHTTESRMALANELEQKVEQKKIVEQQFDRFMEVAATNGHDKAIEASWVHGKEIADNAAAEMHEMRLNAWKMEEEMEREMEEASRHEDDFEEEDNQEEVITRF